MAQQARALRTREKLVQALERLLRDRDFDRIAVSEIAAEANVSVGSVYSHFKNKEAFMEALLDEREQRIRERLAAIDEDQTRRVLADQGSLSEVIDLVVASSFAQIRADAHLIRATHYYSSLHGGDRDARWQSMKHQGEAGLAILFDLYTDEVKRPDIELAKRFFAHALESYYLSYCLMDTGNDADPTLSDEEQAGELSAMLYAYLTCADRK